MQLKEILENEKDEYDKFVAAQESGSFLQGWEWGMWQSALGRQVISYKLQVTSEENIGTVQLIKMSLPFGRFYLYAPRGPVWAESYKLQVESYQSLFFELGKKFPQAVFFRIEPKDLLLVTCHLSQVIKSANIQPAKTLVIDLTKPEEEMLSQMHPKTRYNIKVAQKHNVEVKEELEISVGHGLYFKEAVDLICQTSKRQGFSAYPFNYYQNLMDMFALNRLAGLKAHLYKALYQNQLLAAAIMIDFGKTRTFLFGGSSEVNKNVMAPYLLHWKAMLDAQARGLSDYDFWGVETSSGATPGFVRFKLGFGGQEKGYAGAYDIVNNQLWYRLYKLARVIKKLARRVI